MIFFFFLTEKIKKSYGEKKEESNGSEYTIIYKYMMKSLNMLLYDDTEKMINIPPVRSYDVAIEELPATDTISKVKDYLRTIKDIAISKKFPSFRRFYWIVKYDILDRASEYWYLHMQIIKNKSKKKKEESNGEKKEESNGDDSNDDNNILDHWCNTLYLYQIHRK
ncbi:uncharacterized protein LOC126555476 isoform X4 [Aphis gossypii]|uniref:uncharacterized protein LOC126555476 isoform X2 n=1 Tax=Aphis gossypii TaxID=80765 RepID=UPI0021597F13|nr:uncharacterized protein LOC126555476 isoform X2 [Aphis gossypii]XP_050066349.1 uncharacterized protein LOC126555476 isoform X3 [Aphis gossypii]XP_050066351.1 uncharacterized protein LOC126555476 isoform X4 [Aphis gossypii]